MKLGLFLPQNKTDYNQIAASYWIRIFQMIEFYEDLGIEVHVNKPFKTYDIAIFYRKIKPKYYFYLKYLKVISNNLYFDTCINVFDLHEEIDSERLKTAYKFAEICDGFICASDVISEKSRPFTKRSFVMEDPVNPKHLNTKKTNINLDNPTFGWTGIPHKSTYLNKYAKILDNRTILITKESIKDESLDFSYQFKKWDYNTFNESLLLCDIAFLPRHIDTKYNSGHSSHKALVFAWLGIPIIANKIPSYVKLSNYYDGIVFLEDYQDDIQKCIEVLKKRSFDTSRVTEYYSCSNQAQRLLQFFKEDQK